MYLQIWKEFVWCGTALLGNLKWPPVMAWCLRLSSDTEPGLPQLNFHGSRSLTLGNSLPQIYVTVFDEIKKNYECIWQGASPIQHILTSHPCTRGTSHAPQLPWCLCVPYCIRKNMRSFVLFGAFFCYGGASVSAKDFVMLQPFTGEHSNQMSLLHLTTS